MKQHQLSKIAASEISRNEVGNNYGSTSANVFNADGCGSAPSQSRVSQYAADGTQANRDREQQVKRVAILLASFASEAGAAAVAAVAARQEAAADVAPHALHLTHRPSDTNAKMDEGQKDKQGKRTEEREAAAQGLSGEGGRAGGEKLEMKRKRETTPTSELASSPLARATTSTAGRRRTGHFIVDEDSRILFKKHLKPNVEKKAIPPSLRVPKGRAGQENEKVGENRRFRGDTGGDKAAAQSSRGEGGGAGGEKLKRKRQVFKAKGKRKMWRRESVFCPREPIRQGRSSMGREWMGRGQEEAP
jgi:hypothetical protein